MALPILQHPTRLPGPDSPDMDFRGPRGQLKHRCALDHEVQDKLSICTGCNAVRYCSREHQVEDRARHKAQCTMIKRFRAKLVKEEDLVRNATPDFMTPANAFETSVGHFWGIPSTRDYMRTRFGLADALRKLHTLDGVAEALSHLQDMMRLCRGDNMGLRELIPYMMLQLDRDQECYDFIKWYETEAQRDDYDWGDMDLPFLNVRHADPLEDTDYMDRRFVGLNHISAVMILKMKILIDCSTIRLTRRVLAGKIPVELWRMVEHHVIRSPISVKSRLCSKNSRELAIIEDDLSKHIGRLGSTLCDKNEHFVAGLLDPDELLKTRPEYYSAGTVEETMLVLQHGFPAWWQHEGVLELLHTAKANAAKDSDIEIDDTIKSHPSSSRTKAELIEDVSRNRLWGYIDWAVEDSRDLSRERPSDRHMRELHERWRQCGMHDTDEGEDEGEADLEDID